MNTSNQPPTTTLRQVSEGERIAHELRNEAQRLLLMAEKLEATYGVKHDPSKTAPSLSFSIAGLRKEKAKKKSK